MLGNAWMIASWSASRVRAPMRRKMVFSLEKAPSIGEQSGEYEGRKQELAASGFDGLLHPKPQMNREIVQDHDLPRSQAGSQDLFDVRLKGGSISRAIQQHGFTYALHRQ